MNMRCALYLFGALALLPWTSAAAACEPAVFSSSQVLYRDAPPELAWTPVAGATGYLVEIVARVPEGPIVERRAHRTEQTFTAPSKLDASRPTKISLTVTAQCGEQLAPSASRVMLVTPSKACAAPTGLTARTSAAERSIAWAALAGTDYELRAFDAVSGELTLNLRTRASNGVVIPGHDAAVIAVRALCGPSIGATSYLFMAR